MPDPIHRDDPYKPPTTRPDPPSGDVTDQAAGEPPERDLSGRINGMGVFQIILGVLCVAVGLLTVLATVASMALVDDPLGAPQTTLGSYVYELLQNYGAGGRFDKRIDVVRKGLGFRVFPCP